MQRSWSTDRAHSWARRPRVVGRNRAVRIHLQGIDKSRVRLSRCRRGEEALEGVRPGCGIVIHHPHPVVAFRKGVFCGREEAARRAGIGLAHGDQVPLPGQPFLGPVGAGVVDNKGCLGRHRLDPESLNKLLEQLQPVEGDDRGEDPGAAFGRCWTGAGFGIQDGRGHERAWRALKAAPSRSWPVQGCRSVRPPWGNPGRP